MTSFVPVSYIDTPDKLKFDKDASIDFPAFPFSDTSCDNTAANTNPFSTYYVDSAASAACLASSLSLPDPCTLPPFSASNYYSSNAFTFSSSSAHTHAVDSCMDYSHENTNNNNTCSAGIVPLSSTFPVSLSYDDTADFDLVSEGITCSSSSICSLSNPCSPGLSSPEMAGIDSDGTCTPVPYSSVSHGHEHVYTPPFHSVHVAGHISEEDHSDSPFSSPCLNSEDDTEIAVLPDHMLFHDTYVSADQSQPITSIPSQYNHCHSNSDMEEQAHDIKLEATTPPPSRPRKSSKAAKESKNEGKSSTKAEKGKRKSKSKDSCDDKDACDSSISGDSSGKCTRKRRLKSVACEFDDDSDQLAYHRGGSDGDDILHYPADLSKRERNKLSACAYRKRRKMYIHTLEEKMNGLNDSLDEQAKEIEALNNENKMLQQQLSFVKTILENMGQPFNPDIHMPDTNNNTKKQSSSTNKTSKNSSKSRSKSAMSASSPLAMFALFSCLFFMCSFFTVPFDSNSQISSPGFSSSPSSSVPSMAPVGRRGRVLLQWDEAAISTTTCSGTNPTIITTESQYNTSILPSKHQQFLHSYSQSDILPSLLSISHTQFVDITSHNDTTLIKSNSGFADNTSTLLTPILFI